MAAAVPASVAPFRKLRRPIAGELSRRCDMATSPIVAFDNRQTIISAKCCAAFRDSQGAAAPTRPRFDCVIGRVRVGKSYGARRLLHARDVSRHRDSTPFDLVCIMEHRRRVRLQSPGLSKACRPSTALCPLSGRGPWRCFNSTRPSTGSGIGEPQRSMPPGSACPHGRRRAHRRTQGDRACPTACPTIDRVASQRPAATASPPRSHASSPAADRLACPRQVPS